MFATQYSILNSDMEFLWLRYDKTNAPVVQEAGEFDMNLGFETIILRSKLNLYNI